MKLARIFVSNFIFFLCAVSVKSAFAIELPDKQPKFLSPDEAFIMSHELINDKHVRVSWKIEPGYYLYMGMFEFESLNEDNKINRIEMPDGKKKTDEFFGEVDIYYFSTSADIYLENSITETADLKIKYQGCADAGLCYPPVFKKISLKKKIFND